MNLARRITAVERKVGTARACRACGPGKPCVIVVIGDDPVPPPRACTACGRVCGRRVVVVVE